MIKQYSTQTQKLIAQIKEDKKKFEIEAGTDTDLTKLVDAIEAFTKPEIIELALPKVK